MDGGKDWRTAPEAPAGAASPPPLRPLPPHLDPRLRGGHPRQNGPWQPSRPPRPSPTVGGSRKIAAPRRSPVLRALSWLAVLSALAIVGTAGGGYLLVNHYDSNITRLANVFSPSSNGNARPAAAPRDARNLLIVGSDSRGKLKAGQGTQGVGKEFVKGQRSDTVILAHLYGDSDKAQLVSFPRDSWVSIPAFTDPTTGKTKPEHMDKLNSAFEEGGPALLVQTIQQLTGERIRVDNFLQIDFDGFQQLVNSLGGVEVCLSQPAKEHDSGINLAAGRQTISGPQALAFVRQRKGLANGDLDRIRRQQQFIGAIVRKVLSAGTLLNPLKLNSVLDVATKSVQVDDTLSFGNLRDLALRFRSFNAGGVSFETVPVTDISATRGNGQSVVLLDDAKMATLFSQLQSDSPPAAPSPAPSTGNLIVAPSAIRVRVYNGAGTAGLGSRGAADLASVGFRVIGTPGNRGSAATTTTISYGPDRADSARTVAAAIPGSTTRLDPTLTGPVEVVLGSGYSGARPVSVSGAPTATASPAVRTAAQDPCAP